MANIAIVIYSTYHHVAQMAESVKSGVESSGNNATIYQVPETLSEEVLTKLYAPAKPDYPIATTETLVQADGIIFGFPTRFGSMPAQMKSFIDSTGGLWGEGKLYQKPASAFISTGSGGGRETTVFSLLSTLTHHGMLYIPLGYAAVFGEITDLSNIQGSTPWGAGTIAGSDGSRQPTENDLKIANIQGKQFAEIVSKMNKKEEVKKAEPVKEVKKAEPVKKETKKAEPVKKETKKTVAEPAPKKKNAIKRFFSKIFN